MNLKGEIFLAWRYLKPQKSLITMLTYISLIGPMLGVGVLLVVMSVMNGIPQAFTEGLQVWTPHISIENADPEAVIDFDAAKEMIQHINENYRAQAAPFTTLNVLLEKEKGFEPFLVKGISPSHDAKIKNLKEKSVNDRRLQQNNSEKFTHYMPDIALEPEQIIVSADFLKDFNYSINDTVTLYSETKFRTMSQKSQKTKRVFLNVAQQFVIAGTFNFQTADLSKHVIFMHQDSANELNSMEWGDTQKIEVALENPDDALAVARQMSMDPKFKNMQFLPWGDQSGFTQSIQQQKELMAFVLFFIMMGAAVAIAACLFSLVIQKTKEIGILKSIGASPLSIVLVFLSQGIFVGTLGSTLGLIGGRIALKYRETIAKGLGAWDPQLYRLKDIPMYIDSTDVNLIFWGAVIICLVAAFIPALVAACVNPVKALQIGS